MTRKPSPQMPKVTPKAKPQRVTPEVEIEPGAWERFEKLMTAAGKSTPKPKRQKP